MAGSLKHVISGNTYQGLGLLENYRDAAEAVEELAFVLLETTSTNQREKALAKYYACYRGERKFPHWWREDRGRTRVPAP